MRKILLIIIIIFCSPTLNAQLLEQGSKLYLSEALFQHLPKYTKKANAAYRHRDYKEAERLFDSLVDFGLKGSYMDDFKFYNLKKKEISIYDFKKPVYLLTYASWCVPGKGEIPALNKLAEKYHAQIDFVVLYWDSRKNVKDIAKQYSKNIQVVYVDETSNEGAFTVRQLKHSLGLPTCYLMDGSKKIMDISRKISLPYNTSKEESYKMTYQAIEDNLTHSLLPKEEIELAENTLAR